MTIVSWRLQRIRQYYHHHHHHHDFSSFVPRLPNPVLLCEAYIINTSFTKIQSPILSIRTTRTTMRTFVTKSSSLSRSFIEPSFLNSIRNSNNNKQRHKRDYKAIVTQQSSLSSSSSSMNDNDSWLIDPEKTEIPTALVSMTNTTTTNTNEFHWKTHPALQPMIYHLPTLIVPNDIVHTLLQDDYNNSKKKKKKNDNTKDTQNNQIPSISLTPFLATHMEDFQGIHPRIKIVRDFHWKEEHLFQQENEYNNNNNNNVALSRNGVTYHYQVNNNNTVSTLSNTTTITTKTKFDINKSLKLILLHPQRVLYGLTTSTTNNNKNDKNMTLITAATTTTTTHDQPSSSSSTTTTSNTTHLHPTTTTTLTLNQAFPGMDSSLIEHLQSLDIKPGPTVILSIPYTQQSVHKILASILPTHVLPAPTGFEQIGHVIHLNLKKKHLPYRRIIGEILLDRFQPIIQTIVNKVGEVSGPFRTYDMEVLAGKEDTMIQLVEDGMRLKFDLRNVYWCTRLSGERSYLVEEEFQPHQIIVDAFCGVGALCLQAATKLNATVYANDLNPDAIQYFQENVKNNGIKLMRLEYPFVRQSNSMMDDKNNNISLKKKQRKRKDLSKKENNIGEGSPEVQQEIIKDKKSRAIHITCSDAFDFLQNVGWMNPLPHHIVMNYPLDSISFLGALRWWPSDVIHESLYHESPLVHLYTFAHADDNDPNDTTNILKDGLPPRDVMNVAIDLVADGLIPEGGALEKSRYRKSELDKMGCDVRAREVRDVAPGKVVVCVSLKITYQLIRVMQGDFIIE